MKRRVPETEQSLNHLSLFAYFDARMEAAFGKDFFWTKIVALLCRIENGTCGVETGYFTYPALLLGKGEPVDRYYVTDYGLPPSDGAAAATPAQRKAIADALRAAGFTIVIPPWFNDDYTPKTSFKRH